MSEAELQWAYFFSMLLMLLIVVITPLLFSLCAYRAGRLLSTGIAGWLLIGTVFISFAVTFYLLITWATYVQADLNEASIQARPHESDEDGVGANIACLFVSTILAIATHSIPLVVGIVYVMHSGSPRNVPGKSGPVPSVWQDIKTLLPPYSIDGQPPTSNIFTMIWRLYWKMQNAIEGR